MSMITTEGNKWTEACSHLRFVPKYINMYIGTIVTVLSLKDHREEQSLLRILIKTEGIFGFRLKDSTVK